MKPPREMTIGAGIFCVVCGARPYPELGPPQTQQRLRFDEVRSQRASGRESSLRRVVLLAAFQARRPRLSSHRRMDMGERGARTSRGRVMIGPPNRVPGAHAAQIETALALTAPGQAAFADLTIPHTCGDCVHWVQLRARAKTWVAVANTRFACEASKASRSKHGNRHAVRSRSPKKGAA